MQRSIVLALTLVAAMLAAGCASPNAPTAVKTASVANNTTAPSAANATVGAVAPPMPTAPTGATAWALAFDGDIPAFTEECMYTPANFQCVDSPPTADFSKISTTPAFPGKALSGTVSAKWTSAAPTEDSLTLAVYSNSANGANFKLHGYKTGASPLTVDLTTLEVAPGAKLYIGLFPTQENSPGAPAGGWEETNPVEQPYKLTGSFLVQAK